jgi:hypothetical protein
MPVLTERQFAIFDDVQGIREDIPNIKINKAYSVKGSVNVMLRYGRAQRIQGRLRELLDNSNDRVRTPDTNPVIRYHRHYSADGTEYEFCATKANIYLWSQANGSFSTMFTCASDCVLWEIVSFKGNVIVTNWVDFIQYWSEDNPGMVFAPLDGASGLDTDGGSTYVQKAKYLTTYENKVIIGFTQETGTVYPRRVRACSLNDETDWQSTGGSGDAYAKDFSEGEGLIKGFGHYLFDDANLLVVFKDDIKSSHYFMWTVESDDVFATNRISNTGGLLATHSVVNDVEGNLYYIGADYAVRKLRFGVVSRAIAPSLVGINQTYQDYIDSTYFGGEYNQLAWTIPGGPNSTGNDKVIRLNLERGIWEIDDFTVCAWGNYSRQSNWTIDTIPYATIDGIGWATIDTTEAIAGFQLDLCSDYEGYTYDYHTSELDDQAEFTASLVLSTDLSDKGSLGWFKRCWSMRFFFKRQSTGTVDIYFKEDEAASWESLGEVDLTDEDLPGIVIVDFGDIDLRFRTGLLKLETTNAFGFLGVIFNYDYDGEL